MIDLSPDECIARIEQEHPFEARVNDGAFEVRIRDYAAHVCTAIHAGHRMRDELLSKCALSESERLYEEDPLTDTLVANQPVTVFARDSRFEYDLNRAPEACIYEEAWGKAVWKQPLTETERRTSLDKHAAFYAVLGALYRKLESLHPAVLTYDVHSYNWQRPGMGDTPVFNVGTEQIDMARWEGAVNQWVAELSRIRLPDIPIRAAINEVFFGRGYHATFVRENLPNTLILPSEVKKIFMDENTGTPLPDILASLHQQFEDAITRHASTFVETCKQEPGNENRCPEP